MFHPLKIEHYFLLKNREFSVPWNGDLFLAINFLWCFFNSVVTKIRGYMSWRFCENSHAVRPHKPSVHQRCSGWCQGKGKSKRCSVCFPTGTFSVFHDSPFRRFLSWRDFCLVKVQWVHLPRTSLVCPQPVNASTLSPLVQGHSAPALVQ